MTAQAAAGDRPSAIVATPFVWEGGRGRGKPTVHNLVQGLVRHGYDVHVVTGTNARGARATTVDGAVLHPVRLPLVPVRFPFDADHSFLTSVRAHRRGLARHLVFRIWWLQHVALCGLRARRLALRLRPAFTYGVNNPGVPVAFAAGRAVGAPAVARIMGTEIAQVAGVDLDGPDEAVGSPRRSVLSRLALAATRFDELLAFRLPCSAWFVTDDGQVGPRTLTEWLGVPPDRLFLWRNGVDKERFGPGDREAARAALAIDPADKVVLWVSQLTDWKHPERLLGQAPAVLRAVPETRFVFVGDGPERAALERRASALGVAGRVRFEGFVAHDRMPAYYRAADAFTALYDRANVANTLLEAMLCGLPAVALDNGRTREAVIPDRTGLLVPPETPAEVGPTLVRLLSDDALRGRLAVGAARWADENLLTWDARIDREIEAIEALVGLGDGFRPALE